MHGGSAPQVKDKAHGVVLADVINPALLVLRDTLNDDRAPAAVKVRAALGILDRSGHTRPARLTVAEAEAVIDAEIARLDDLTNQRRLKG